jgi:hypothetical protein
MKVSSKSKKGVYYTVTSTFCTCPAFTFQQIPVAFRSCPHKKSIHTIKNKKKKIKSAFFFVGQRMPSIFNPVEYVFSRKLDGIRVHIVHGKYIITRSGFILSHIPIPSTYKNLRKYIVDAELIYKDPDTTTSYSVMKNLHDASVMHIYPFSIVGKSILESIKLLKDVPNALRYFKLPTQNTVEWIDGLLVQRPSWEGIVCRSLIHNVVDGSRISTACFKVKRKK